MEFLTENFIIVLMLPLMLGMLTLTAKFFGLNLNKKFIILSGIIFSLIGFISSLCMTIMVDNSFNYQTVIPFIDINNFKINLGIYFGKNELILASLLYFISFIIQIYSISYIDKESHNRFFALINLFIFSMSGLILSFNLFQFYIFWELIGLFSYLLIGFEYKKYETGAAAQKVFLINRIGDFCLLLGIIISSFYIYTNSSNLNLVQLPFEDMNLIASNLYGYSNPLFFTILSSLFLIAALCKSAQYPFSSWVIHAMKAPTPVSALIHSATLVTAGIILFLKLMPLFQWSPQILSITAWIVLISAIITSISALTQTNLKKLLAYSTSAHLGIMFLITALGYYQIAIIYLIAHAIVKSILFCNSGISDKITNEHNIFNLPSFGLKYVMQTCLYIKRPLNLFDNWASLGRLNWMSDKWYLSLMFRSQMGYWMDWRHPRTFNEKLQWLKIYNRDPLYTKLVDKYEVRKYIAEKIGEEYLIPLLGVWNSPDEIDFDQLPNQFVLKCTHDSGSVIICKNKPFFDKKAAQKRLERSLSKNYYYFAREWPYKNVKPRIIAEKYIEDEEKELKDYKFFCFNGEIKFLQVDYNRFVDHHRNIYNLQWEQQPFSIQYPSGAADAIKRPPDLNKMLEIVHSLSRGMPHVRIDLYNISGQIFCGELTFFHEAGFGKFSPPEWDLKVGSLIATKQDKHLSF